jgi:hypothetical protein
LPYYEQHVGVLSAEIREQLLSISAASIERLLKAIRPKFKRKGFCSTKPGTLLKNQVPIKTGHWNVTQPGYLEADTVTHCGNSLQGDSVWSLTLTDIHSTWIEIRALWGKGSAGVITQIKDTVSTNNNW